MKVWIPLYGPIIAVQRCIDAARGVGHIPDAYRRIGYLISIAMFLVYPERCSTSGAPWPSRFSLPEHPDRQS